uniref:EGF-like domain-containing protein n=1 Tax=Plectus sambesii TaxID=2011161 RepID=A0A914W2T8_9BILA
MKANMENYAGPPDLDMSIKAGNNTAPMTTSTMRMIRYANFAFRGCLEDTAFILGLFDDRELPDELKSTEFHQAGTCSTVEGAIFSSKIKASLCSCAGQNCNNEDASEDIGAVPAHQDVNPSSFSAECPPQSLFSSDDNDTMPVACSAWSPCPGSKLCCPAPDSSTNICKDPLYAKQVAGAKCSEARFTNNATGQILSAIMQTNVTDMNMPFPPFSSDCNQAQSSSSKYLTKCKTHSVVLSITADFLHYNGPELQSNVVGLWMSLGFGPKSTADIGKVSLMTRMCAEELFAEAMSNGFPMIGNGVETLTANILMFNAPVTISLQACNSDVTGGCANAIQPLSAIAVGECLGGFEGSSCGEIEIAGLIFSQLLDSIMNYTIDDYPSQPCPPGLTGALCDYDIDACSSSPCENNGTCIDLENSFHCMCMVGFIGQRCNVGPGQPTSAPAPNNSSGASTPPSNFLINGTSNCLPGQTGSNCTSVGPGQSTSAPSPRNSSGASTPPSNSSINGTSNCPPGQTGSDCTSVRPGQPTSAPSPRNSSGTSVRPNNSHAGNGTSNCPPGQAGGNCTSETEILLASMSDDKEKKGANSIYPTAATILLSFMFLNNWQPIES